MTGLLLFCCLSMMLGTTQVFGATEYRLGAEGNAWQAILTTESTYQVLDANGQPLRQVQVGLSPFAAGADTLVDFSGNAIQPRFIDPSVNIARTDVEASKTDIPLPYMPNSRVLTSHCWDAQLHHPTIKLMLDGNPATAAFRTFVQKVGSPPGVGFTWTGTVVFDFGGAIPINRIRFYPRLSRFDDRPLIEPMQEPKPDVESFGEDSFLDNFLAWYEIRTGDNSVAFAPGPCSSFGTFLFNTSSRNTGTVATSNRRTVLGNLSWVQSGDPKLSVLENTRENLDAIVDMQFPTRSTRWLTLRAFPLRDYEIAEFEIYGEGYVNETTYVTPVLDFGQAVTWGKIRWDGEVPAGTRIQIRTRTGQTPDPNLYFTTNINNDLEPITQAEHAKIEIAARLVPTYDADNWSFWSPPYEFAAGERDPNLLANTWQDGTALLSPGPSRYIQIAIKLFSNFSVAPRLDQLTLQLSETLSAQALVGEIWPIEVTSFAPTSFTYVVLPTLEADNAGFDRLEILTHNRAQAVTEVRIDGQVIDLDQHIPQILDDRLIIAFPALSGRADNFKQVEVDFDVPVLRFGTEFSGWVFSSGDLDQIRQSIDPGNSTFRFSGDLLAVNTPVGGDLLVDVVVPRAFTPNGDGVNETLEIAYKLREVTRARPVRVQIYDLAGGLITQLPALITRSGTYTQQWDGRDGTGALVQPGTYIYQLTLDSEEEHTQTGVVAVAY
jgi:gliding motility-associated-like protein